MLKPRRLNNVSESLVGARARLWCGTSTPVGVYSKQLEDPAGSTVTNLGASEIARQFHHNLKQDQGKKYDPWQFQTKPKTRHLSDNT